MSGKEGMQPSPAGEGTHPLRLAWHAVRTVYEELFPFVALSLLTEVAGLLLLPGPPAWMALHEAARQALDGRAVHVSRWKGDVRTLFPRAWRLAVVWGGLGLILGANVLFYVRVGWRVGPYIALVWGWLLFIWGLAGLYVNPLSVLQEDPSLTLVLRNSVYLVFLRPVHTVIAAFLLLLSTLVSLLLPIFLLILPAFWATYTTLLTRALILDIRRRAQQP